MCMVVLIYALETVGILQTAFQTHHTHGTVDCIRRSSKRISRQCVTRVHGCFSPKKENQWKKSTIDWRVGLV